jgi:tetratricopeptide (TPR) repeat protein
MKIQLGIVEQRAGHLADAERALGEGLALDPGHPAGLIRLGVVRLARGNESAGREDLSRAIALMGPDSRYKNWELRQAIEEIPDTARSERGRLALGLGLRLQASGALEQAEEQYLAASTLLSDSFDAWNNLGVTYALRGRYADALGAFTRALSIAPGHPKACANAQRATAALGVQPHEALARCRG